MYLRDLERFNLPLLRNLQFMMMNSTEDGDGYPQNKGNLSRLLPFLQQCHFPRYLVILSSNMNAFFAVPTDAHYPVQTTTLCIHFIIPEANNKTVAPD